MPNPRIVGTKDFLFDAAQILQDHGYDFVILLKQPGTDCVSFTGNVGEVEVAEEMTDCLIGCFAERFPDDPEDDREDDEESV